MKAVVELGGKQYLIEPGTIFLAEKVDAEKGKKYTCKNVLCILDDDDVILGKPYVDKGKVTFSVLDQTKRRKVISQYFRAKKGLLKIKGHRQEASQLQVEKIEGAGKKAERVVEKKKKATRKKKFDEAAQVAAATEEVEDETSTETEE